MHPLRKLLRAVIFPGILLQSYREVIDIFADMFSFLVSLELNRVLAAGSIGRSQTPLRYD